MRALNIYWLAAALALAGCADGQSVVSLTVTADSPFDGVAQLHIEATDHAHNRTAHYDAAVGAGTVPPAVTFPFLLPKTVRGQVTFAVTAQASNGSSLATGSVDVSVTPSHSTAATVTLEPAHRQLAFVMQPSNVKPYQTFTVAVGIVDDSGMPIPTATDHVTLSWSGGAPTAVLSGHVGIDAANGVATYPDLSLNLVGTGYTLTASAPMLDPVTSASFDVTPDVWVPINAGLEGGSMTSGCADPKNPGVVWLTSIDGAGTWRTGDGGNSWSLRTAQLGGGVGFHAGLGCAIGAQDPNLVYLSQSAIGLQRTRDNGSSWESVGNGLSPLVPYNLLLDPTNDAIVYAYNASGLSKSTDSGATFSSLLTDSVPDLIVDPANPTTLYALVAPDATSVLVEKSTDGGAHWAAAVAGLQTTLTTAIAIDPTSPATLYASNGNSTMAGVYKSTDGAQSWTSVSSGTSLRRMRVDPTMPTRIFGFESTRSPLPGGSFATPLRSTDGGATWQPMAGTPSVSVIGGNFFLDAAGVPWLLPGRTAPYAASDKTSYAFAGHGLYGTYIPSVIVVPPALYAIDLAGIVYFGTSNGSSWQQRIAGLNLTLNAYPNEIVNSGTTVFDVAKHLYSFDDTSTSWAQLDTNPLFVNGTLAFDVDRQNPQTLLAIGTDGTPTTSVLRSTNGGANWTATGAAPPAQPNASYHLTVDPTNSMVAYIRTGGYLYQTTDAGAAFTDISPDPAHPVITVLSVDSGRNVYVGTSGAKLWKGANGGPPWTQVGAGLPTDQELNSLAIDPSTPTAIYASTSKGELFKSTDGAASFSQIAAPPALNMVAVDPTVPRTLYAATNVGMWISTTGGQ